MTKTLRVLPQDDYPIEVQRKRTRGWRSPPNTVSVCRPGTWGNPHAAGKDDCGDVKTAVVRFEHDLITERLVDKNGVPLLRRIHELRGKNLSCFCKLGEPCHRTVLMHYANIR